jgi:hypothetical protein
VDVRGPPRLLAGEPGQIVTLVEYDTRKVGAIATRGLLERPSFSTPNPDDAHRDGRVSAPCASCENRPAEGLSAAHGDRGDAGSSGTQPHDGAQQRLTVALVGLRRSGATSARPGGCTLSDPREGRARSPTRAGSPAACTAAAHRGVASQRRSRRLG